MWPDMSLQLTLLGGLLIRRGVVAGVRFALVIRRGTLVRR
jgi:hypothetical protein